jgi:hypothetical protein
VRERKRCSLMMLLGNRRFKSTFIGMPVEGVAAALLR